MQGVEVDFQVRQCAIRQHHAAVTRARLDGNLEDAGQSLRQFPMVALHIGVEFFDGRVLVADLANLATQRDIDAFRLDLAHVLGQAGAERVVRVLLLIERRIAQID